MESGARQSCKPWTRRECASRKVWGFEGGNCGRTDVPNAPHSVPQGISRNVKLSMLHHGQLAMGKWILPGSPSPFPWSAALPPSKQASVERSHPRNRLAGGVPAPGHGALCRVRTSRACHWSTTGREGRVGNLPSSTPQRIITALQPISRSFHRKVSTPWWPPLLLAATCSVFLVLLGLFQYLHLVKYWHAPRLLYSMYIVPCPPDWGKKTCGGAVIAHFHATYY